MTIENPIHLARQLKGAPLSILYVLSLVRQPVTAKWLSAMTGYSAHSITKGLMVLEADHFVICDTHRSYWRLAGDARQLPLGAGLLENPDREKRDPETQVESDPAFSELSDREKRDPETQKENEPVSSELPDREKRDPDRVFRDPGSLDSLESLDLESKKEESESNFLARLSPGQILSAAASLFGNPIRGKPGEYSDPRLLLAWIAHAHDTRGNGKGQTHSPAGLVYWAFHAGAGKSEPDPAYLDDPLSFLPDEFLGDLGLSIGPPDCPSARRRDAPPGGVPTAPSGSPLGEQQWGEDPWGSSPCMAHPPVDPSLLEPVTERGLRVVDVWQAAVGQLEMDMPKAAFDTWMRQAELLAYQDGLFTIGTANAYARDWLDQRLSSTLTRLLTGICNRTVAVEFVLFACEQE